ncbi:hypothetical protein VTL71DRAFT_3239 [Oculimacula yallundae]|uniref:Uncharacterized protein n=1 Tax=Oculimacula yallundae TaxID=86028 RepID=A0ABR4C8G6_9HELO
MLGWAGLALSGLILEGGFHPPRTPVSSPHFTLSSPIRLSSFSPPLHPQLRWQSLFSSLKQSILYLQIQIQHHTTTTTTRTRIPRIHHTHSLSLSHAQSFNHTSPPPQKTYYCRIPHNSFKHARPTVFTTICGGSTTSNSLRRNRNKQLNFVETFDPI